MKRFTVLLFVSSLFLLGCASQPNLPPIRTADYVDLTRFAGDWYVIAAIPTFLETDAFNAVESYALPEDGKIATTFRFNDGGFDGPEKVYRPTGFVRDEESHAVWGMQFVWPIKAEYRVVYIDDEYETTIIGRTKRDYVWIMARTPGLPAVKYEKLKAIVAAEGYDLTKLRLVPQELANQQ